LKSLESVGTPFVVAAPRSSGQTAKSQAAYAELALAARQLKKTARDPESIGTVAAGYHGW
jgi:hypothetical protein